MRGVEEIESLYAEIKKKFAEARAKERRLAELAERPEVAAETRQQALQDIRSREGAIEELEREWRNYVDEVKHVNTALDEVRAMIPTLEVIRANAESQISVLQLVALLGILKQNLETVRGTVDALQGFRLAPLTSNRVRRLLSI
jgi:chromosome segregation ATPase